GSLGLAVLVTVAARVTGDGGRPADLAAGYAAAFWVCAGLLVVAALVAVVLLPGRGTAPRAAGAADPEAAPVENPEAAPVAAPEAAPVADPETAPVAGPESSQKNFPGTVDPAGSRSTQG
ncbi:hypothetical protein AB0Q97_30640, partial [Streptomyces sp. NPDC088135]